MILKLYGVLSMTTLVLLASLSLTAHSPADDGWTPLFNGKDLTGWKIPNPPSDEFRAVEETKNADGKVTAFVGVKKNGNKVTLWRVEDGMLIGGGPASHIFSERGDYENFHYRIECKINDKGNSGQYFRAEFGPSWPKGYEAQINASGGDKVKTGSLYPSNGLGKERDKHTVMNTAPHKPDEWFTQEVIAVGPRIIIKVNDQQTVDYTIPGTYLKKGHFALQGHDPGSVMTFRKVEVKEIP